MLGFIGKSHSGRAILPSPRNNSLAKLTLISSHVKCWDSVPMPFNKELLAVMAVGIYAFM